jgi:hypothetical protein
VRDKEAQSCVPVFLCVPQRPLRLKTRHQLKPELKKYLPTKATMQVIPST